jgi:integrase
MSIKNVAVGVWKVTVSVRVPGKPYPIKRKATVRGTKAEAKLKEAELIRAILAEGQDSSLKTETFATSTFRVETLADGIDLYIEKLRSMGKLSRSTQRKYIWMSKELGHVNIKEIAEAFDSWKRAYCNTPTAKGNLRKAGTVNQAINIIKAVCNHLVELEVLPKNPISRSRFPKARQIPREVYLSKEEKDRLFEVIRKERPYLEPIVRFLLQIPCRAFSELVRAKVSQLQGNMIFIPTSKNGDSIFKPFPLDMADYVPSIPKESEYIFYRKAGGGKYRPITCLPRAFDHCRKLAGLPNLRIHDLRHVAVSELSLKKYPNSVIQKMAGWRTDMMRVYFNMESKQGAEYYLNMEKEAKNLES